MLKRAKETNPRKLLGLVLIALFLVNLMVAVATGQSWGVVIKPPTDEPPNGGGEPPPPPPGANCFVNPSVEYDDDSDGMPDYWHPENYPDVPTQHIWSTDAHDGTKSLLIVIGRNDTVISWHGAVWRQLFYIEKTWCPLERGKTYKWRCWFKSQGVNVVELMIGCWNSSYNWRQEYSSSGLFNPSSTWKQSDWMYFTVPNDIQAHHYALGPYIKLKHIETGVGEGRIWVDAFEMYETAPQTLSFLDIDGGWIQINALWILLVICAAVMTIYPESKAPRR